MGGSNDKQVTQALAIVASRSLLRSKAHLLPVSCRHTVFAALARLQDNRTRLGPKPEARVRAAMPCQALTTAACIYRTDAVASSPLRALASSR